MSAPRPVNRRAEEDSYPVARLLLTCTHWTLQWHYDEAIGRFAQCEVCKTLRTVVRSDDL